MRTTRRRHPSEWTSCLFAPKLGATYRVSDRLGVFFQYAHGFRSPPPEDVNIGLEVPLFNVRAIPNPDLQPETSDGFEVGLRLTGLAVALTASVFHTEYSDFIESKVNLGVDPVTGVTLFQSQNVAEARIYGAELDARIAAGAWSPATRRVDRTTRGFVDARRRSRAR